MTGAIEQAWVILRDRNAKVDALKSAVEQAGNAVSELDSESELASQHEAQILAGMTNTSIEHTLKALQKLDDESASRMLTRKIAVALAAQLDARAREIEAAEAARDPAEVRREHERAQREAQKDALFARVPTLFRTDFMISQLGKAARSRTPRPQGRHTAYAIDFSVPRALEQNVMASTRIPEHWPPRHGDLSLIEQPYCAWEEAAEIVAPLRRLNEKSSPSEDEVQIAIDRAQHVLLNEFARVCAEIRSHYPDGLPRFFALPSFTTPRSMAAE